MQSLFDLTYYGLAAVMFGLLCATAIAGVVLPRRLASPPSRNEALGLSLAALGALVTLLSGVVLTELERAGLFSDVTYQQARFSLFYAGFGLILYGVLVTAKRWPIAVCAGFAATVLVASAFLFNTSSYTFTQSGTRVHAAQQLVFYLPLFFVPLVGILLLPIRAARSRTHPVWLALFCAAILLGFLRESTIIPSLGDPEVDVLVAFVPFALGSLCLLVAVGALAREGRAQAEAVREASALNDTAHPLRSPERRRDDGRPAPTTTER